MLLKVIIAVCFQFLLFIRTACSQFDDRLDKAMAAYNEGRYEQVIQQLDELLSTGDPDPGALFLKGRALFQLDRVDDALVVFTLASEADPTYTEPLVHRAVILSSIKKQHEEALQIINTALRLEPRNISYLKFRASFHYRKRDYAAAVNDYDVILSLKPSDPIILCMRGSMKRLKGDVDGALKDINVAMVQDSTNPEPYQFRANLYDALGQFERSVNDYSAFLSMRSNDRESRAAAYNNRGYAYWKLGRISEAQDDIEKSITLWPENSYAFRNRALVLLSLDKNENACRDLARAQELGFSEKYGDEVERLLTEYCSI